MYTRAWDRLGSSARNAVFVGYGGSDELTGAEVLGASLIHFCRVCVGPNLYSWTT